MPSDSRAVYEELELKPVGPKLVEVSTKRSGLSGVSYATRLVNCATMQFRYVAEGDSIEEWRRSRAQMRRAAMGPLVAQSISYYVAMHACRAVK